jgi:membrane protein involved in colicin uptake
MTDLKKIANEAFKLPANMTLKELHFTSDGTAFVMKNDANNHSFTLKDKTVTTIPNSNSGLANAEAKAEAEAKAKAEAEAKAKAKTEAEAPIIKK